jgi:two-component system, cell cycle sensor histidine kinase and response regulator CckA
MTPRRRLASVALLTASIGVLILLVSIYGLYRAAYKDNRARLREFVSVQARLIEAVARFDAEFSADAPGGPFEATLGQLREAYGDLGPVPHRVRLVQRVPGGFRSLIPAGDEVFPLDADFSEPMRRSLSGETGFCVAPDLDGSLVLAAFEPVEGLDLGLVAGLELRELRKPYLLIALLVGSLAVVLIVVGTWVNVRVAGSFLRRLEQSERKFRTLFETSSQGIFLMSDRILECNDEGCEMLGRPREDVIGRTPADFSPATQPDGSPSSEAAAFRIQAALAGGAQRFEWSYLRADGEARDAEVFLKGIEIGGGTLFYATVRDVTERKKTEAALRENELKYRRLFNSGNDPIFVWGINPDGTPSTLIEVNNAACERYGYSREELRRMTPEGLAAPGSKGFTPEALLRLRRHRRGVLELEHVDRFGNRFPVEISSHLFSLRGLPTVLSMVRDLGERHRAQEERLRLEGQLQQAQRLEAIGRLAGGIAHDFDNLMTIVRGYSELLLAEPGPSHAARMGIEEIRAAADRAAELTRQLLTFSRKHIVEPRTLNLNHVVKDMETMIGRLIGEDIALRLHLHPELQLVRVDPAQIEQVIMNLCVNARDAMPQGGELTVATANVDLDDDYTSRKTGVRAGSYVMLSIADTGMGMDEATMSRIFEPFFTTKERDKGTGLGLATSYGIVKKAEGNIWVYSEPGKGSVFKVYLPARSSGHPEEASVALREAPLAGGSETILVVEDDIKVRRLLERLLGGLGYTTVATSDPREAIDIMESHSEPIHLLLTDVILPTMSGRVLADRLVRSHPDLRVVFVSGYTDNVIADHGVLEPGVAFLEKPFTREDLGRKVRAALDGNPYRPADGGESDQSNDRHEA